ncbi:MAG: hypothetical protein IJ612_07735 [Prevotella sp.]|nr:hypothetical protein [Prevotella sp.]
MKTRLLSLCLFAAMTIGAMAQAVTVKWEMGDVSQLEKTVLTGDQEFTSLLTTTYAQGAQIDKVEALASSGADQGYNGVAYTPAFAVYTPKTRVTSATSGHDVTFTIAPAQGHTLKVTKISFDCLKVGTDGGNIDATAIQSSKQTVLSPVNILRNKISETNSTGYAHNEYDIADMVVQPSGLQLVFALYNINGTDNENPKALGLRNITIEGVMDEAVFDVSHFLSDLTCTAKTGTDDAQTVSLYNLVSTLKNGQSVRYTTKLYAAPADFQATLQPAVADSYTATTTYDETNNTATVSISNAQGKTEFSFSILFTVTNRPPKGQPVALKRGLMALHTSGGNLVSWRARKADGRNYKFKLFRGATAETQNTAVNSGNYISGKTNFLDASASANSYYRLEVYDAQDNLVETEVSGKTWDDQTKYITLQGGAPTDPTSAGATYTPNDASFCDMDGDGEYEIILKWAPSNEKDAASSGTTSPAFYSCYKLDGTRLWMMHTGHNMFNSAHTTPFVAWDMDGDGFGEFMVKTAPGAIDGEGNYVLMDGDDPTANLKSSRGKQDHGSEYMTIFDGTTGAELQTVKYHTAYADVSTSFWGDSNQNRSERYLGGIAWLDGEDQNPSGIFARGYYSGCNIGAYDWDGQNLTLRWLHRGTAKNAGTVTYADGTVKTMNSSVYGEGAHSFSVGDVTGDGKQEITYGSGAINVDGTTLYRTGLEHGDATHLGDFIPSRPGQEFFMPLEHSPYGANLRDARTGEILFRITAGSDTGRGLIGHFNPEAEDAYWQTSADANLYDTSQNIILENVSHGGGAGLSFRIFWNGTLADDFYGKNVLEYWNPEANAFWRMQVNGTNYVPGNYNNSSKQNPCVMGDLLGDWREEIVTWTETDGNYQLMINATNYQTDYTFPHLMDDYAYRAQLIAENSVYNQPPHVSYDPRTEKTITPRTFYVEPTTDAARAAGSYWGSLYTTYPVYIPDDVTAWAVANRTTDGSDTLRVTSLAAGKIIPANRAIIFCSKSDAPRFVPTSLASNVTVSTLYLRGQYYDQQVADPSDSQYAYELRDGERGIGLYRTHGNSLIPGGEAYALFGTNSAPGADNYVMGPQFNALAPTGIDQHWTDEQQLPADDAIYSLQGVRLSQEPAHGVFIKNGVKYSK